mmetsp:Transcript_119326/g.210845  ORF Transcript_119326/g.210845 Transcript_119326/m.210845 type:complete len:251 (-) Transcript_119326:13-765(-)
MAADKPWKVRPPNELRGQDPLAAHYRETVQGAFVALFRDDSLLLVQGKRSGEWQLPGGWVDKADQHVWEAASREFYEEMGSVAPLPKVGLLGWFESSFLLGSGGTHRGAIFVLSTTELDIPYSENNETKACCWIRWAELGSLIYRYPNNLTIPMIYDHAQSKEGSRPAIKRGPWAELRPTLDCGDGARLHPGAAAGFRAAGGFESGQGAENLTDSQPNPDFEPDNKPELGDKPLPDEKPEPTDEPEMEGS